MSDHLPRDFRYECTIRQRFGEWERRYVVEGRDGACEFWCRTTPKVVTDAVGGREFYGGFELHRASPSDGDGPPDHGRCSALSDRACWHDGTSSYASEVLIPRWQRDPENHEAVFRTLVAEYRTRFAKEEPDHG